MAETFVSIAPRFRGPPDSGNGGYVCGLLAEQLPGAAEVTLRAPPPLSTPLALAAAGPGYVLAHDGKPVAEARSVELALELPEGASFADAARASLGYPGFVRHPYPSCFVCGPQRAQGDGLGLYPGPLEGRRVVAAPWAPARDLCDQDGRVGARFVWSALDCPSWFGYAAFAEQELPILLGRLTAEVKARPRADEPCVVLGWSLGRQGRRIECASALLGGDGQFLAWARAVWIEVKS
jgi:hypothetical protein